MGHDSVDDIPTLLADHGPATGPEIASLLDVHPATVERRCKELQRREEIRLVTGGRYATDGDSHTWTQTASD